MKELTTTKDHMNVQLKDVTKRLVTHQIVQNIKIEHIQMWLVKKINYLIALKYFKKNYHCPVEKCGKSYTDPSSLRKHIKNTHGEHVYEIAKQNKAKNGRRGSYGKISSDTLNNNDRDVSDSENCNFEEDLLKNRVLHPQVSSISRIN